MCGIPLPRTEFLLHLVEALKTITRTAAHTALTMGSDAARQPFLEGNQSFSQLQDLSPTLLQARMNSTTKKFNPPCLQGSLLDYFVTLVI